MIALLIIVHSVNKLSYSCTARVPALMPAHHSVTAIRRMCANIECHCVARGWKHQTHLAQVCLKVGNLVYLSKKTDIPLIQLTDEATTPIPGSPGLNYSALLTEKGLAGVAKYAAGLGPYKGSIVPIDGDTNLLGKPNDLVELIHKTGMQVCSLLSNKLRGAKIL